LESIKDYCCENDQKKYNGDHRINDQHLSFFPLHCNQLERFSLCFQFYFLLLYLKIRSEIADLFTVGGIENIIGKVFESDVLFIRRLIISLPLVYFSKILAGGT